MLVAGPEGKLWCVWVTGEVPQQQLGYAVYSAGRWQKDRRVPAGQDAHGAAATLSTNGTPVLVWAQKDPGAYRIYLSNFEGDDWQPPTAVSPTGNDCFRPDVFCLPSGKTFVAWYGWKRVDLTGYPNSWWRSIYVCEVVGGKPGMARELAELQRGSDDCWDPVITGDAENLQVSWLRDENPPKLWGSASSGSGWLAPASMLRGVGSNCRVQAAAPVRSTNARRGVACEMFAPGGLGPARLGTQIYMIRRAANGWGDLILISASAGRNVAPAALELTDGTCLVFWCQEPGQRKPSAIRMRRVSAGEKEKTAESLVVTGEGSNRYPSAAVDNSGTVWLAWESAEGHGGEGIYVSACRAWRE